MAEFTFPAQSNYGWVQTFNMGSKAPIVSKRIFDTYENALAYVNDAKGTAIPGLLLRVIKDSDTKKNGVYFVTKAAGYDGVEAEAGEMMKLGEGAATIKVDTYAAAQALATSETIGQLVYLTKEDTETTPDTTYAVGLYVVTGASTLERIGTTSSSGNIEDDLRAHTSNSTIHLPSSIGTDGQILKVESGAPKWVDDNPNYELPVAGEELGGIKNGGDITISPEGVVTVTVGTNHTHTSDQIIDLQDKLDAKADANIIGDGFSTDSTVSQQLAAVKSTADAAIPATEKGTANGVATLNENGKVPVSQLDGAMAKVFGIEKAVANADALPIEATKGQRYYTIDTKKIYEKTSDSWSEPTDPKEDTIYNFRHSDKTGSEERTNILYRWDGQDLVEISASLALGETSGTAYEGNKGKANADAIAKLNGEEGTEGSVKNTVKTYIDGLSLDTKYASSESVTTIEGDISTIKAYTVNGKPISENPVLSSDDILMTGYTGSIASATDTLNQGIAKLAQSIQDATSKAGVVSLNGQTGTVVISSDAAGQLTIKGAEEGQTISINGWDDKADKATVEAYTINGKLIKDSPTLSGADIVITGYVKSDQSGVGLALTVEDTVNVALGKLEKAITDNEFVTSESINKIKTATGLSDELGFVAPDSSNYLADSTSVKDALGKLDAAIKTNETTPLSEGEITGICTL